MSELRFAVRQLRSSPLFTLTAVLTLALGIGANTAIFTLIQGILLRSLPVASPAALYRIGDTGDCCVNGGFVGDHGDFDIFSYNLYQTLKAAAAPEFTALAAVEAGRFGWPVRRGNDFSRFLQGELVSGNYFSTLGVQAFAGRVLQPSDESPTAPLVCVLSYSTWQTEFGGDRNILGSTISVMAHPFTVVGIAPRGFFGDEVSSSPPAIYAPLTAQPIIWGQDPAASVLNLPDSHWLYPIGRLRAGASVAAVQAKLSATLRHWLSGRAMYTSNGGAAIIPREHVVVVPAGGGIQSLQQDTGAGLELLMILAGLVLLIACANIANMMLARGAARRGEVALRMALGESRGRLLRRHLQESVLLGLLGGLLGLVVAYGAARVILTIAFPRATHSTIQATPTLGVLAFAFAVAMLTAVLFGLAPAWAAAHADPAEALRGGLASSGRTTRDRSSFSQRALIVFEVALSLVLLVGALITTRSLANLQGQNFGIATAQRYVLHFDPNGAGYTADRLPALYHQIKANFGALPGVAHIGLGMYSPLEGDNWGECVIPEGHPAPGPHDNCGSTWERVSAGFLASVGVPILEGRDLSESDTASSQPVAVVNQAFVKRFFPHQDPIGQHFGIDDTRYSGAWTIVGVFRDFKINNPRDPVRPVFLRPLQQIYTGFQGPGLQSLEHQSLFMNAMVVDFSHMPPSAPALLRRTMAQIDPNLILNRMMPLDQQVEGNFNQDRLLAWLAGLFGGLALILACVGLYGVTAYLVARRTSEIGVRMALGASRGRVVGLILRGVGVQVGIGLAVGIPAAVVAARLMASQMYGVGAFDPRPLAVGALVLLVCALAAGLIPARRAASVDPIRTLRAE